MIGEIREQKSKLEKRKIGEEEEQKKELSEDWGIESLNEKLPNLSDALIEELDSLQKYTSEMKKEHPKEVEVLEKSANQVELRGVLVLPEPKEEKKETEIGIRLFRPFKFLTLQEKKFLNFCRLKKLAPDFAKEGLTLFVEREIEFFKGESLVTLKKTLETNNRLCGLKKDGKATDETENEVENLNKLRGVQGKNQFVEKIKKEAGRNEEKIIKDIAKFETFRILIKHDMPILTPVMVEVPLQIDKEEKEGIKNYLLKEYHQVLKEEIIDRISEEFIKELKKVSYKKRKEEGLPTDYAA